MEIAVVGVSHKEANVELRGEVAFTTSMKERASQLLVEAGLSEFVILSTCNRSEIFIGTKNMNKDINIVKDLFVSMGGQKILSLLFVKKFEVALAHIYQVSCGLDSLIIGEDEILGQIKKAHKFALEAGTSKKYLNKVLREAITFSKKIRSAYKLSENQLSVASIGIQFLKDKYSNLLDKKILLVGTGEMGQLILRYLETMKLKNIWICNRTMNKEKVDFFIDQSIHVIEYEERYKYLEDMDIVISATASPHTIIVKDKLHTLKKNIMFLDMAVPRDVDSSIDDMGLADVITLDTFTEVANEHIRLRHDMALQINRLILEEVKELELWILRSKVDGVVKAFHTKQGKVIEKTKAQVDKLDLTREQEVAVMDIIKSSTWQMVKSPIHQLKAMKEVDDIEHYKMIIEELFDFESGDD